MIATPHAFSRKAATLAAASVLAIAGQAHAQTFLSGSTGADGAFSPTANTVLPLPPNGVFNYTTVTIPAGVTVTFQRNAANTPVTILATGDVTISGTLSLNAGNGLPFNTGGTTVNLGGAGGPGGFNGGNGGLVGGNAPTAGQGPGGGPASSFAAGAGNYGAPSTFVGLLPLFGGSGGGGAEAIGSGSGPSSGGGGGAVVVASSTKITVGGTISANGGNFGARNANCGFASFGGSGGAIRLVAPQILGAGSLQANGGVSDCGWAVGGPGRIRLEAFTLGFSGTISPIASQSVAPGPVTASSSPAIVALPTISVASVAGVASPPAPGGSLTAADVSLPAGTTNPVSVILGLANVPVGSPTAITLRLLPQSGAATTISVPAASQTGTFSSSTATTNVTLPTGQVSVLQAWATMTLTGQIARLFPLIDGQPVTSVAMASALEGGKPVLNLVTASGRQKRLDELAREDQLKVALAWQTLAAAR